MKKIGLFGGTFDPIHIGHIKIAEAARDKAKLSEVIFIPAGEPPHKTEKKQENKEDRLEMTKLAVSRHQFFSVSDYEIKLKEKSYSLNLIKHFKKVYPEDKLYFIIGADSLYDLPEWYHYEEFMTLCEFIVISRPGIKKEHLLNKFSGKEKPFRAFFIDNINIGISSTQVRQLLKEGESVRQLVPAEVCDYIEKHGLYK